MQANIQVHNIPPLWAPDSRILILGSFPSVQSRLQSFFYAHPQNRFWRVIAAVLERPVPVRTEEKRVLLLEHHIALWDVVGSCQIRGSSDASIRNAEPNRLSLILNNAPIRCIFCNGGTAHTYYDRLCRDETGDEAVQLPSTSPANARWSLPALSDAWREALRPWL